MEETLSERFSAVVKCIEAAAQRAGRDPSAVLLVAVSKRQPVAAMNQVAALFAQAGRPALFGESYVQEFREKKLSLSSGCAVHLIGPLQSNKAKEVPALFDLVESVDRESILAVLDREAGKAGRILPVMLQVNISNDPQKAGFSAESLEVFLEQKFPSFANIKLDGLMTITKFYEEPSDARPDFARLRELRDVVLRRHAGQPGIPPNLKLSMGMSADYEIAIEEGADLVRVGTAIFGVRD